MYAVNITSHCNTIYLSEQIPREPIIQIPVLKRVEVVPLSWLCEESHFHALCSPLLPTMSWVQQSLMENGNKYDMKVTHFNSEKYSIEQVGFETAC